MSKELEDLVDLMFDTNMEEVMKEKSTLEYIHKLQQENKQLKGILQEIYERAINTNITSLDFRDYILAILGDKENE